MKKILKFILYFILFVLLVLFTAPFLFKGKIIKIANEQISNNVNADAYFEDINLSFFKQFPYLTIGIKGLTVKGIDDFENDTLLYVKSFDVAANVISAVKMENIEIKKISISNPVINAIILEDGKANWNIAKESETEEEATEEIVEDTTQTELNTSIALKSFKIENANISYTDEQSGMKASLKNYNFDLSGDFSQKYSTLLINTSAEKLNFIMDGIKYLRDVSLDVHLNVDANLEDNIFVLQENSFALNDFTLSIDGQVEMPDSADMIFDLSYATSNTSFKTLLSLVPAIYLNDFSDLKTSGKLALNGTVKGNLGEEVTPNVKGKLTVQNAMFSYPDLPKKAENINIDIDYFYDGRQMDNTTVDINKFHVELGENPIDLALNLKTPISDPFINGKITADVDLATLTDLIPLEDTEIKGLIKANLDMMGNLSVIEEEKYEDFKADGKIILTDIYYKSPDVPQPVDISKADIGFSPKYLAVNDFKLKTGNSSFELNGQVSNYLPYVMKDETISGVLNLNADIIDANQFLTDSPEEETEETTAEEETVSDTSSMEIFEVPTNINFTLKTNIKTLYYDKLEISNVLGYIYIKDGKAVMEKLSLDMLDGNILLSGEYNTQDIKNPLIDFSFQATTIDIPMAASSFEILEKIVPIASKATGKVSLGMDLSSFLDQSMKPVLSSMVGSGNFASKQISIKSSNAFSSIGKQLNTDTFDNMALKDLDVAFEIRAGKLFVDPFETNIGKTKLLMSGEQGFDKTMDYDINITLPRSLLGTANTTISNLASSKGINIASSDEINMLVNVSGDMANPKVSLDMKESLSSTTETIKEELKETATKELESRKEDAKKEAQEQADKIMADAETKAKQIKKEAKKAADAVRYESDKNADELVKNAKNPIAKKAAEATAEKIRKEGEAKAQKIEDEADTKSQKILDEAKRKSDQLLK